jgi:uncharacterized membrane protein
VNDDSRAALDLQKAALDLQPGTLTVKPLGRGRRRTSAMAVSDTGRIAAGDILNVEGELLRVMAVGGRWGGPQ